MPDYREFYVSGGTLRPDAPCYVERRADRELWDAVRRGEFCYVLTPRQMGKSSLMVRTAYRLRAAGVHAAILDLTTLGGNVTPEQWYFGLLTLLGDQLDLDAELESYWYAHSGHGPLRRLIAAIEQVVLPQLATRQRPHADLTAPDAPRLVIFIDEIDTVRSLSFPTDEFFAAVRELYNRRAAEPALRHLTLCLLGVATPADLIRESRSTPFNIGRCVELDDFTLDEALPLAMGLTRKSAQSLGGDERQGPAPEAQQLLGRVVYWTGGHPYLTQKLCLAVAEALASRDSALPLRARARESLVDGACAWLFFEPHAMQRDDSLLFVQERMLRADPAGSEELAARLERYRQVRGHGRWRRSPVRADATDPVLALLRLSGITRSEGGFLVPRNRIYARLFDE
ncbi:MAG: GUN4-like family, partial [Armatimonadetes bacterium]|nr:GUN4-like family [Armatimonadota bacterium]